MCDCYNVSREIVLEFIDQKGEFSLSELREAIIEKGGAMRVAPSLTIKDYLNEFEEAGILDFIPKDDKYLVAAR